ncbi:hypothetical protein [Hungatella sp.]
MEQPANRKLMEMIRSAAGMPMESIVSEALEESLKLTRQRAGRQRSRTA